MPAFEALGQYVGGKIDQTEFKGVLQNACPGAGACGGMFTANTMGRSSADDYLQDLLAFVPSRPELP
jgi:dihydroxy-acid dehydratase